MPSFLRLVYDPNVTPQHVTNTCGFWVLALRTFLKAVAGFFIPCAREPDTLA